MSSQSQLTVKGSWEDLLQQADDFSSHDNDACIPIWQKIMDRLGALPPARLDAGEGHLRKLRLLAAVKLQQYFTYCQRYDEALQIIERLETEVDPLDNAAWQRHTIETLLLAGRKDEALAKAKHAAESAPLDDIDTWGNWVYTAISQKAFASADEALREIERRINRVRKEHGASAAKEDGAFLSWLRANQALAQALWDEAIAWWTHASTQDKHYEGEVHNLYVKLLRAEQPAKALTLIERDQNNPIRADFWRGLALTRLGKEKEGEQYWRRIATIDATKDEHLPYALTEYFLAHYYLPELRDRGLASNLRVIQEIEEKNWGLHYLCALGFAVRNEADNAHIHLNQAILCHRKLGLGPILPQETWFPFADLIEEEKQNQFKKYFLL